MTLVKAFLWIGRITAALLFVLWGAFFLEHLTEWFKDSGRLPPWSVFLIQFFHLLMLVGYLIVLKWKIVGSITIILGAALFFGSLGTNAMMTFFAISIFPAIIFLFVFYFEKSGRSFGKTLPAHSADNLPQFKD
ncbi:MAG: hypothetical protein M0Q21_03325 [Ignavibacteriaceae bacterium]|nr:hypothetical protein [Ignavibacteriaceae bacterium]